MDSIPLRLLIGLALGVIIGLFAYRLGALSRSGAWAAALTGGLIFGLGGVDWAVLLLAFFISSSAWSRAFTRSKSGLQVGLTEKYAKGSQRDWAQVLANGGLGALLAVVSVVMPGSVWPWVAFAGVMAAVNADTWATELGVFNPAPPRLITSGRVVERGTSGGVSLLGYLAALGGAALVGVLAWLMRPGITFAPASLIGAITLAGVLGATIDSILGATVQAIYFCPQCAKETERHPLHTCGTHITHRRGWRWLDNDLVNLICSFVGAVSAWGFWVIFA
jgi:uncharacterized protein (TIGR00297 family)